MKYNNLPVFSAFGVPETDRPAEVTEQSSNRPSFRQKTVVE